MTKILIAEDESILRDMIREMLENEGYEVTIASDGSEAIMN